MASVKSYSRSGALIEDLSEDFKQTQESTIGPTPVVVDPVGSPEELAQSVREKENRAATFVRSSSLDRIYCDGLRWAGKIVILSRFVCCPSR